MTPPSRLFSLLLLLSALSLAISLDCFDTKCVGTDTPKTTIPCDQALNICTVDPTTGLPTCTAKEGGGEGVDCRSANFFCAADSTTGVAACDYSPSSCYNDKCVGSGDKATETVPCDQRTWYCSTNKDGSPVCNPAEPEPELQPGVGVNCTTTADLDEFYCSNNATDGQAVCNYPPKKSCYNNKCAGSGEFNETIIDCDQSANRCGLNETTGYPLCIDTTRGDGVKCTTTAELDEFYCSNNATNGVAVCNFPPKQSCYNNKCTGSGEFNETLIDCDQSANRCVLNETTGYPLCINTTRGDGVNCTTTAELDEFYCSNDEANGEAVCNFPPKQSCYNNKCIGSLTFYKTIIDCDESANRCGFNETGYPLCINTTRGDGVNCTTTAELDEFYCSNNATNGDAVCNFPPKKSCYNNKCTGSGEFNETIIDCDQSANRCGLNETGYPLCINTTRGAGVNCTTTPAHDEYYCSTNATTGAAVCEFPPKHDCYNTKCAGSLTYNTTLIDCDQESNRCELNEAGFPRCINTTRGTGLNCPHTTPLDFYCKANVTGISTCVSTPPHSCYSQFCAGTGDKNTTIIACDGAANRCVVESDGTPNCTAGSHGVGADCNDTMSYYCGHSNVSLSEATCVYSEKYSCYNNKCYGALNNSQTAVGCDQKVAYCSLDSTGFPLCVDHANTTGAGILCSGHFKCVHDDMGVAACKHKDPLVPLYIVLGIVAVLAVGAGVIFYLRKRGQNDGMRQALLS